MSAVSSSNPKGPGIERWSKKVDLDQELQLLLTGYRDAVRAQDRNRFYSYDLEPLARPNNGESRELKMRQLVESGFPDLPTKRLICYSRDCGRKSDNVCKERFLSWIEYAKHCDTLHPHNSRGYICPEESCPYHIIGHEYPSQVKKHWVPSHGSPLNCPVEGCNFTGRQEGRVTDHVFSMHIKRMRPEHQQTVEKRKLEAEGGDLVLQELIQNIREQHEIREKTTIPPKPEVRPLEGPSRLELVLKAIAEKKFEDSMNVRVCGEPTRDLHGAMVDCAFKTSTRQEWAQHFDEAHSRKARELLCPIETCPFNVFGFAMKSDYIHHYRDAHVSTPLICPVCEFQNYNLSQMKHHVRMRHPSSKETEAEILERLLAAYAHDGKVIEGSRLDLLRPIVQALKPYGNFPVDSKIVKCTACNLGFKRLVLLADHLDQAHSQDPDPRPFKCVEQSCPFSILGHPQKNHIAPHYSSWHPKAQMPVTEPQRKKAKVRVAQNGELLDSLSYSSGTMNQLDATNGRLGTTLAREILPEHVHHVDPKIAGSSN